MIIQNNFIYSYIGRIAMSRKNNYGKLSKNYPDENYPDDSNNVNKIKNHDQNHDSYTPEDIDPKKIVKNKSKNDILIIINNLENILDSNDDLSHNNDYSEKNNIDTDYDNELKFFNDNFKIEHKEKIFDILKFKDVCLLSFDCIEKISKWIKNEECHDLKGMYVQVCICIHGCVIMYIYMYMNI
jgi:hypothetical protein